MIRYMCSVLVYVFNVQALLYIFFSHCLFLFLDIMKGKTIYMGGRRGRVRERHKALREGNYGERRGEEN